MLQQFYTLQVTQVISFSGRVQRSLKFPVCLPDISHLLRVIIVKAVTQHAPNYGITRLSLTQLEWHGHIIKVKNVGDRQTET